MPLCGEGKTAGIGVGGPKAHAADAGSNISTESNVRFPVAKTSRPMITMRQTYSLPRTSNATGSIIRILHM